MLASLISILVGLLVGGIAVILVGCFNEKISLSGAWDGFRIIFAGIFSTGRNAAGELTWGFNAVNTGDMLFRATPLIMTVSPWPWPSRRACSTSALPVST